MSALGLEVAHHLIDALLVLSFAEASQVRVERGDRRVAVTEIDLELAQVLALLKEVRGVRVSQRLPILLMK
jgi:hypothetical protein